MKKSENNKLPDFINQLVKFLKSEYVFVVFGHDENYLEKGIFKICIWLFTISGVQGQTADL